MTEGSAACGPIDLRHPLCARAESFCLVVRVTKGPANTVVSRPPGAHPKVSSAGVHYTPAPRWYNVVTPRDAISALEPFDLEASLRQREFLFAGRVTTAAAVRI